MELVPFSQINNWFIYVKSIFPPNKISELVIVDKVFQYDLKKPKRESTDIFLKACKKKQKLKMQIICSDVWDSQYGKTKWDGGSINFMRNLKNCMQTICLRFTG